MTLNECCGNLVDSSATRHVINGKTILKENTHQSTGAKTIIDKYYADMEEKTVEKIF